MTEKQIRKALAGLGPMAKGTLSEVRKPCIRTNCPACRSGRKHKAFLFSYAQDGKRRCMYVAAAMVPALRQAICNGRVVEAFLHEAGPELIRQWRKDASEGEES